MAPSPTSPSTQALERPPARWRRLLIGFLGFLALIWYFYSSNEATPQTLYRPPRPQVCPQETRNVAIIGESNPSTKGDTTTEALPFQVPDLQELLLHTTSTSLLNPAGGSISPSTSAMTMWEADPPLSTHMMTLNTLLS